MAEIVWIDPDHCNATVDHREVQKIHGQDLMGVPVQIESDGCPKELLVTILAAQVCRHIGHRGGNMGPHAVMNDVTSQTNTPDEQENPKDRHHANDDKPTAPPNSVSSAASILAMLRLPSHVEILHRLAQETAS